MKEKRNSNGKLAALAWCLRSSRLSLSSFRPSPREPESRKHKEKLDYRFRGNDGREAPTYSVNFWDRITRAFWDRILERKVIIQRRSKNLPKHFFQEKVGSKRARVLEAFLEGR